MKKILVIGAARSGVAVVKALLERGKSVILTDTRDVETVLKEFPQIRDDFESLSGDLTTIFDSQIDPSVLEDVDIIVLSPGVPWTIPVCVEAQKKGIPVISEVEAAYRMTKTPFTAITGTNGKTTTTTLTAEIFEASQRYHHVYTVGNIGDPITRHVNESGSDDMYIAEISSFQLETSEFFKPKAAALLNLAPDHLDRHGTVENYYAAKVRIFANQTEEDLAVLNADDENVCRLTENIRSKKVYFSYTKPQKNGGCLVNDTLTLFDDGEEKPLCTTEELGIKGPHNVMNALTAACLAYFSGIDTAVIRDCLMAFKGVEHRQEFVATIDGVDFINDSKGTNTDAAIVALKAMTKPTILIAGGFDKSEDYTELIKYVKQKVKHMFLIGKTAHDIADKAEDMGFTNYSFAETYPEIVDKCFEISEPGDVVLLSPACASWDMFDNYEIRGNLFKKLVLDHAKSEK